MALSMIHCFMLHSCCMSAVGSAAPYLVSWVLLALCGWLFVESEELDSE